VQGLNIIHFSVYCATATLDNLSKTTTTSILMIPQASQQYMNDPAGLLTVYE